MTRKLVLIATISLILAVAGLPGIAAALTELGLVGLARNLRAEYLTGTAITVIIALLILLPRHAIVAIRFIATTGTCHVCRRGISRPAKYCPHCGSRTAGDSR